MPTRQERQAKRRQAYENFIAEQSAELRDWIVARETEQAKKRTLEDQKLATWLANRAA